MSTTAELLRIAVTLQRALAELARVPDAPRPDGPTRDQVERWTLRWVELVETMLQSPQARDETGELRAALEELRRASAQVRERAVGETTAVPAE